MPLLVRWFHDLTAADVGAAGGKGANLGEMARAGLPVPPGFVLLTDAYRAFVASNSIQAEIERLAAAVNPSDPADLEIASQRIRALFDNGAIPVEVARATAAAYAQLGMGLVAVRSSATAEDLPGASFAGQQETYLNIEGEQAVLEAVRRCWSSLWTARAMAYRINHAITPDAVALAVVIQRLVQAEVAGILFTANPVNGRRDQMVIDGAWGLGEAVVSGQVTPDHWVADGKTGAVVEVRIGSKEVMTVRRNGGTETRRVDPARQNAPVLDTQSVEALVALGRQTATHFGSPQDIEWALDHGQFYLVQSRPITSLYPLPQPTPDNPDAGLHVYFSFNNIQGIVEPFTPAGISLFQVASVGVSRLAGHRIPKNAVPSTIKVANLRMYVDVTRALQHRILKHLVRGGPEFVDRPMAQILEALLERQPALDPGPAQPLLRPNPGLMFKMVSRVVGAIMMPDTVRRRAVRQAEAEVQRLEAKANSLTTLAERLDFLTTEPARLFPVLIGTLVPMVVAGMGGPRFIAEAKIKLWLGDASGFDAVLRSLPHNPTTEMDLELWRLSRTLKAEGAVPSADHPAVKAFLAQYGHRAVREIDAGMPRWNDDPGHVLNILRTYLSQGEDADPVAHFERGAREAEQAVADLVGRVRRAKGPIRAGFLRFLLRRVRALAGMREFPKFTAIRIIAVNRLVFQGVGQELHAQGRIDHPDDVFFLDLRDLKEATSRDLRAIAAANRAEYDRELGRRSIPRVITSNGEAFYGAPASAEGALVGTPASAGVHEGVVRVVHDPTTAQLQQGEVLVAPGTDPAWTPLFLTAGALVMEIGGSMSHGSVVAREYGIPAVVGVAGATTLLKTGQRVRVDGETGTVVPLDV